MNIKHEALRNLQNCLSNGENNNPWLNQAAKNINTIISKNLESLGEELRMLGYRAAGDDRLFELESAIYDYIKQSNPEIERTFELCEKFGSE